VSGCQLLIISLLQTDLVYSKTVMKM